jgi:phospholipid/cholesterol/gamma-HCH transport system permease protein
MSVRGDPPARPAGARQRLRGLGAVVDGFATAAGVVQRAVRPGTWRRPVRREFARVLDLAGPGSFTTVLAVSVLVGLGLVAQALYWIERVGQDVEIENVIAQVMIREIAVMVTAVVLIGRAGLRLLSELIELRRQCGIRELDRQGIDPFLLLIVPRVLALPVALFCHSVVFVGVAFVTGFFAASAVGVVTDSFGVFAGRALGSLGDYGALVLPVKALTIGFAVGVALCLTALSTAGGRDPQGRTLSRGFIHMSVSAAAMNLLLSLVL